MIFALTVTQASALLALKLGGRIRAESMATKLQIVAGLQAKGLVRTRGTDNELVLTRRGELAAELCANLASNGWGES